jgi:hypothetical protein
MTEGETRTAQLPSFEQEVGSPAGDAIRPIWTDSNSS